MRDARCDIPLRAAVLIVSDRRSAGTAPDRTGPALLEALGRAGWEARLAGAVPDERVSIARTLRRLATTEDLVVTAGGTGPGARDVTPEATREVLDTELPGLGEAMRAAFRKRYPASMLSRATAGVCGNALLLNLPGSPRGAVESLEAVAGVLPHAIGILRGAKRHPSRTGARPSPRKREHPAPRRAGRGRTSVRSATSPARHPSLDTRRSTTSRSA
ncbi:MAG: MogA/MoaB family molybdenum cofactor biosynthesis protein [Planctomycetes bacterium]|nr:MogA/MoaB family molybdenum cofactor biosynthesis protein [Planctomycetota bacterium]